MNNLTRIEWIVIACIVAIFGALGYGINSAHTQDAAIAERMARTTWDCSDVDQKDLLSYEKACMAYNNPNYCQRKAKERLCKKVVAPKQD